MKKFATAILITLFGMNAFAGKMKEVLIMAEDAVYEKLQSYYGDESITFRSHNLRTNKAGQLEMVIEVVSRNEYTGTSELLTCTVQFKESGAFYDVEKTECF